MEIGYIYIREHESYEKYNACKVGKTLNIPERDSLYTTGEIKRGIFTLVLEVKKEELDNIEKELQIVFNDINIYNDGGIEFFSIDIKDKIIPYLQEKHIYHKVLTLEEINSLERKYREKKIKQNNNKINEIIKNDSKYLLYLEAIKNNGDALKYVPEEFKSYELCLEAVKNISNCLLLSIIKDNKNYNFDVFIKYRKVKELINYFPTDIINNNFKEEFLESCKQIYKNNSEYFEYIPNEWKTIELSMSYILKSGDPKIYQVPIKLRNNQMYYNYIKKRHSDIFKTLPSEIKTTEFHIEGIKLGVICLSNVSKKHLNYEICLEAVKNNGNYLKDIPEQFKTYELCLEAVKNNGNYLKYVPEEHKIYELCLEAV